MCSILGLYFYDTTPVVPSPVIVYCCVVYAYSYSV
jgi:hypothetical protein